MSELPGTHSHRIQIYYEDTDHSGAVYHANYLKYFERAREHMLGVPELVRLLRVDGVGFVVYRVELTFRQPARFGDSLEIRSTVSPESDYRLVFRQDAFKDGRLLVSAVIQLACVDSANEIAPIPASVVARVVSDRT